MNFSSVWRLVPRISRFLVFDSRRLVAELPRNREDAESDARAIALLPQVYWAARAVSDSAGTDFVVSSDLAQAKALLAPLGGFSPPAWHARRCSVLRTGRRPLVAHACDESMAAAIAALPELVGSLRFVGACAESEATQRTEQCALRALQCVCWEPQLEIAWRTGQHCREGAAVGSGARRPPRRVARSGADDRAKFTTVAAA